MSNGDTTSSRKPDESRRLLDQSKKVAPSKNGYATFEEGERDGPTVAEQQEQDQEDGEREQSRARAGPTTPLPKMQLLILCIMRLSERESRRGKRSSDKVGS
jgi:hypothetical protein